MDERSQKYYQERRKRAGAIKWEIIAIVFLAVLLLASTWLLHKYDPQIWEDDLMQNVVLIILEAIIGGFLVFLLNRIRIAKAAKEIYFEAQDKIEDLQAEIDNLKNDKAKNGFDWDGPTTADFIIENLPTTVVGANDFVSERGIVGELTVRVFTINDRHSYVMKPEEFEQYRIFLTGYHEKMVPSPGFFRLCESGRGHEKGWVRMKSHPRNMIYIEPWFKSEQVKKIVEIHRDQNVAR